jgi:hypothetical protein
LSTTTAKPRSRARNGASTAKPVASTPIERFDRARTAIASAKRKASRVKSDEAVAPATRYRNAMKVKAEAFDAIDLILAGKDAD